MRFTQIPQQPVKACGGARGGKLERVEAGIEHGPFLIDQTHLAIGEHDPGIGVEGLHAPGEMLVVPDIVVGGPPEVLATRQMKGPVEVPGGTDVARVAVVADSGIGSGVAQHNLLGLVIGGVIADDDLEVREGLRDQGGQGLVEEAGAVAHRQADGHARLRGAHLVVQPATGLSLEHGTTILGAPALGKCGTPEDRR